MVPEPLTEAQAAWYNLPFLRPEDFPKYDDVVTEDDQPVDNIFTEKQARLLTEPLYSSWSGPGEKWEARGAGMTVAGSISPRASHLGRPFVALTHVALYYRVKHPPVVPDVMLSLDLRVPEDPWPKENRSYFVWEYGKPPEVVIEIVSNREGGETGSKLRDYAWLGATYYVILDPMKLLLPEPLRIYVLRERQYEVMAERWLPAVGLGLTLWQGRYEDLDVEWLRWCDQAGNLIPTGAERAEQERQRAEAERQRSERLLAQLRALGVEPEGES